MTISQSRSWLGLYFLVITCVLGAGVLLFGRGVLRLEDVSGILQIIIPVLVGQLTVIFRWYGHGPKLGDNRVLDLPVWVIKGPPLMVVAILTLAVTLKIVGFALDNPLIAPSSGEFKSVVTFCVTLLNATTMYIIARYFGAGKPNERTPRAAVALHEKERVEKLSVITSSSTESSD